jgi:hypothetical protein
MPRSTTLRAIAGPGRVDRRRVHVRAADDRRDQRRLAGGELVDLLAEVRARRGADPADRDRPALAEVDLVQVGLEDAFLRVARLDERGQPRSRSLRKYVRWAQQPHLHELLGDGAPAFL